MKQIAAIAIVLTGLAVPASAQPAAPTFSKDVAPIFFANCTNCHRPGEIAPMSLLTFKDARPWAKSIATKVADGTMPPWHADPKHGTFVGARTLTDAQKSTIAKWVAAGAPEGKAADLPPAPVYTDEWNIGTPDAVLSMQEDYPIPATGEVPYQYFEVPANFAEDRYISDWEYRPGDRRAVHHMLLYLKAPKDVAEAQMKRQQQAMLQRMFGAAPANAAPAANAAPRQLPPFSFDCCVEIPAGQSGGRPLPPEQRKDLGPNYRPRPIGMGAGMGGFSPGGSIRHFPEGTGMRIPAGYSLVFQMHYTTYGQATTDRSKIGLKFTKTPPTTVLNTMALINASLSIPPGAADYTIDNAMTFNRETVIYSLIPHTHVRGTGWHYEAIYPDGRKEVILSVPKYDFNWQHEYVFTQPLRLPAGSKLYAKAWYDNSARNKSNPDPTKTVTWGDQTWEEMMYTSITFSFPPAPSPTASGRPQ
ncbi:MAG: hypothetical protein Q8O42_18940 [Acidobacteriota bacterium]|nr:hypothetical protein [Acidobacteriota bacterium]